MSRNHLMMETITHGPWRITFDREATVWAHKAMAANFHRGCRCGPCKNFQHQKPVQYPKELQALLARLGIDPNCEIETFVFDHHDGKGLEYYGWFYFVGHVEGKGSIEIGKFHYSLSDGPAYAVKEFEGLPVSTVDFGNFWLPWSGGYSPSTPPG